MGSVSTSCSLKADIQHVFCPINGGGVERIQADGASGLDIRNQPNNDEIGKYNFLSNICT